MYYTAVNYKSSKFGKIIWESKDKRFQVWEFQGRFELVKDNFMIAHLIYGEDGLAKYYQGSIENWIKKTEKKDLDKAKKIKEQAEVAIKDAEFIEALWQN